MKLYLNQPDLPEHSTNAGSSFSQPQSEISVNKSIQTVEGIAADPKWKPLIDAYCKWDAMQCGYCTPGFMVSSKNLLDKNPNPTEEECKQALAGNICCCGTYPRHPTAVMEAAPQIAKGA